MISRCTCAGWSNSYLLEKSPKREILALRKQPNYLLSITKYIYKNDRNTESNIMRGSRGYRHVCVCVGGGGPGQSDKKALITFFFVFFESSAYFTEVKWSISKKSIIF